MIQAKVDYILDLMRAGSHERIDVMARFGEKWQGTSTRTFDRYWKAAKDSYATEIKRKEAILEQTRAETLQAEISANIATESELDLVLSKIALGGCKVQEFIKGEAILRDVSPMEVVAAVAQLYKRKGSYAPTKVAPTNPDGTALEQPKQTMSLADAMAIIEAAKKQ